MNLDKYVAKHRSGTRPDSPVFLNHAGASIPDERVAARIVEHLELETQIGGYAAANAVADERTALGQLVGHLINCPPEQVAYVDSGTRAWNSVIYSSLGLSPGDNIVSSISEFGSNLVSLLDVAHTSGAELRLAELTSLGRIDIESLINSVDERTRLVAVSILSAHRGVVTDLDGVGDMIRRKNPECIFLVDACQAVGQLPVDISIIGCDVLTATGRKWIRGPRGTGFLYVSESLVSRLRPPSLDLINTDIELKRNFQESPLAIRQDVKRFESWERSVAVELGLIQALEIATQLGVATIAERIAARACQLREGLAEATDFTILEPLDEPSGIVGLVSPNLSADDVVKTLDSQSISIGSMHDWDAPLFFKDQGFDSTVRISPSFLNTEEDVALCIDRLSSIR